MAHSNSLPSGRDPKFQATFEEQRKARRLLARMDRTEEFASEWERFEEVYPDLVGRDLEWHRQHRADAYRRLVGVNPDERQPLRERLNEISRSGLGSVEAAIDSVRERAAKLFSENQQFDRMQ